MLPEEMLAHPFWDIHVVSNENESAAAEMPREIDELKAAITAEMNLVFLFAETGFGLAVDHFEMMLSGKVKVEGEPLLLAGVLEGSQVFLPPMRVAGVEHVEIIDVSVGVIASENLDMPLLVKRANVLDHLLRERWSCGHDNTGAFWPEFGHVV